MFQTDLNERMLLNTCIKLQTYSIETMHIKCFTTFKKSCTCFYKYAINLAVERGAFVSCVLNGDI